MHPSMKTQFLLFIVLFCSIIAIGQDTASHNFPKDYLGIYTGTLNIYSEKGIKEYPMELHLLASDTLNKYDYTLIYGTGEEKQVRPYTLIKKENNNYLLDENNGIILDAKAINNKLYFLFEVMNNLLTTFITFEKDHLIFEIAVSNTSTKKISGGQNDSIPKVTSYPIKIVQRARLIKQ